MTFSMVNAVSTTVETDQIHIVERTKKIIDKQARLVDLLKKL